MTIELLIASNLVLWIIVIALGAGYVALLRRSQSPNRNVIARARDLIGRSLEDVAPALTSWTRERDRLGLLFLSSDCQPCVALKERLAEISDTVTLLIIGDNAPRAKSVLGLETNPVIVADLRQRLAVEETPYLWMISRGTLVAGGIVNSPAAIEDLDAFARDEQRTHS